MTLAPSTDTVLLATLASFTQVKWKVLLVTERKEKRTQGHFFENEDTEAEM